MLQSLEIQNQDREHRDIDPIVLYILYILNASHGFRRSEAQIFENYVFFWDGGCPSCVVSRSAAYIITASRRSIGCLYAELLPNKPFRSSAADPPWPF